MLQNAQVNNLLIKESKVNSQQLQRGIIVIFTILTDFIILACLLLFQMIRTFNEKSKWQLHKNRLRIIGIDRERLLKETHKRMKLQTFYPALIGGFFGLLFSQAWIRQFSIEILVVSLLIFSIILLVEIVFKKYACN